MRDGKEVAQGKNPPKPERVLHRKRWVGPVRAIPDVQLSILHGYGAYSPSVERVEGNRSFAVSGCNYMIKQMTKVVVA
jgi:hypothetical protein